MKIGTSLSLLTSLLFVFSASLIKAAKEKDVSAPIILTLPNNLKTANSDFIQIKASLELPEEVSLKSITPITPKGFPNAVIVKTNALRDGKVDVDIIIRTQHYATKFLPFINTPAVRLEIGTMSFITVDNISGVFQNENINNQNPNHLQDISISIINNDNLTNQTIENISSSSELNIGELQLNEVNEIKTIKNKVNEISIYPNPITGNFLNVSNKIDFEGITEIHIHNSIGNLVKNQVINSQIGNTIQVDVDNLSNGIYYLTIQNQNGKFVRKFTITH
jgi:hypothetical protein